MKLFAKLVLLVSIAVPGMAQHARSGYSTHKSSDPVQLIYDNLALSPGKVDLVLLSQRGQRLALTGTLKSIMNGVDLDFLLPKSMVNDEWQVFTATQGSTTVRLGTLFVVRDK